MFARSGLSDLTDSLKSGFFADRVTLTLAKAKRRGLLEESDRIVIVEVLNFLRKVLEGFEWTERPAFTTHSAESAEAFSKATRVLPEDVNSSELFRQYIEKLTQDARTLAEPGAVDPTAADNLIRFFTQYGEAELRRTDDLMNPKGVLRIGQWTSVKVLSAL